VAGRRSAIGTLSLMLLWVAFAILTTAVLAFVLAPLVRPVREQAEAVVPGSNALAVYRDQLRELEAEHARGLIGAARPA
jgi:cytochrome c-type biogenesis protein CcmH